MPPLQVPAPWDGLPVTPARLRWRVRRGGRTVRPWRTPVDLGKDAPAEGGLPPDLRARHTPEPRGKPGLYRFYLAHTWSTTPARGRPLPLEVEASDLRGNKGRLHLAFTIANDV